ncbi:hypothetical protein GCM10023314_27240 [Algibacter agarivorans]|uniref:Uncharacterized protein n=1 Tax=Algibacter agarivorans TaxID=1109741 RepID=A0ABP9GZL3_9FLAO
MKYLNYILIIVGAFVAMYAKTGMDQNQYVLIGGLVVLMIGVYRVARTIPSKTDDDAEDNPENE